MKFQTKFPTKPRQVARALAILWWTQGAAIAAALCIVLLSPMPVAGTLFMVMPALFGLALGCLLLAAVAECRNWARILFLITSIFGCVSTALDLVLGEQPISLITGFVVALDIAMIYGLILLFGKQSNAWFRSAGKFEEQPANELKSGNWIRRGLITALALVVLWLGMILAIFFHDPSVALIAFTTDAYPRIPGPVAGAFLRFAPYDPNGATWTGQPLFRAACAGYGLVGTNRANSILTIRTLAAKGVDVNAPEDGYTALHHAVLSFPDDGSPELIRTLLELGANPALPIVDPQRRWNGLNAIEFARALDEKTPHKRDPIIALLSGSAN